MAGNGGAKTTSVRRILFGPDSFEYSWIDIPTTESAAQWTSEASMESAITSAMPTSFLDYWTDDDYGDYAISILTSQFSSGQAPKWFSSLPADAQTYFVTVLPDAVQEILDWGGTKLLTFNDLEVPYTDMSTTQLRSKSVIPVSKASQFMSEIAAAVPTRIRDSPDLTTQTYDSLEYPQTFASLIYSDIIRPSAPQWFTTLRPELQSFVLLAFLPDAMTWSSMPLSLLRTTSIVPVALATSATPGATPTTVPSPTLVFPANTSSTTVDFVSPQRTKSSITLAIALGTVLPLLFLIAVLAFWLYWRRHRKTRGSKAVGAGSEAEQTGRRWSGSVFSTTSEIPAHHSTIPEMPPTLPETDRGTTSADVVRELQENSTTRQSQLMGIQIVLSGPRERLQSLQRSHGQRAQ